MPNAAKKAALTGEVKMPWAADGHSPLNDEVVEKARRKAKRAEAPFFFTWNVNEFVLWKTDPPEDQNAAGYYKSWQVVQVSKPAQLDFHETEMAIRGWLKRFLYEFANFYQGTLELEGKPLDLQFIEKIESGLQNPMLFIRDELARIQKDKVLRKGLYDWMRSELGWTVSEDPLELGEQLTRAASFASYVFVNKLVFHEALRARRKKMAPLTVPDYINTGQELESHLAKIFADAVKVTGDYETVFGADRLSYGDTVPYLSNLAVPHWRALVEQLHRFRFDKVDYDVIGLLFEKLISPEERSKYGQYFTRIEVVDLISSFCMPHGDETVIDPACGGGTFLVRAYGRMATLNPGVEHQERLERLYGVDIAHFPVHLSTINLTVRELIDEDNYPRIKRADFLDLSPGQQFMKLPRHVGSGRNRRTEHVPIGMPSFDAVITNPPYIRQEQLGANVKRRYQKRMSDLGLRFSGRSDLHLYFWPHSASFLKDNGFLGLITSSQWMDIDYGFRLQEWILRNFRIVALIESLDEPWFEGARVATTVAILQKEADEERRMSHLVRFIQIRQPLREVMGHGGPVAHCVGSANAFREEILSLSRNELNERYRARVIPQSQLWEEGAHLGRLMGKPKGHYFGGKWGTHLRAPDLWFDLLDLFGSKLVPLGELVKVHRGITSGKDAFFFPIDCSKGMLEQVEYQEPKAFQKRFGVARTLVELGEVKLVRCGEGRELVKPLEAKYLKPEVHSLMEVRGYVVKEPELRRMVLLLPTVERSKMAKYSKLYVEWAESEGWHLSKTNQGRASKEKHWYDLTDSPQFEVILPKIQQYKLTTILNPKKYHQNSSLLGFNAGADSATLAGILSSSWGILSRILFSRGLGNEGNLQLDVYAANMMLVPDLRQTTPDLRKKVALAFEKLTKRSAMQFLSERRMRRMAFEGKDKHDELKQLSEQSELDMPDRRQLDDAVLELLGVADSSQRSAWIDRLYDHLRDHFERVRQKEEEAIENKNRTRRRGHSRPQDIATEIFEEMRNDYAWSLSEYEYDFVRPISGVENLTKQIPVGTVAQAPYEVLEGWRVEFLRGKRRAKLEDLQGKAQAELLFLIASEGMTGAKWIPYSEEHAETVLKNYREHLERRSELVERLVALRTDDEDRQDQIRAALMQMLPH